MISAATQSVWRTFSWLRAKNAWQVWRSFRAARLGRGVAHAGLPISISVEPTTTCNLRCPQCPSGLRQFSRPTGAMQSDTFLRLLDELSPTLAYLLFYFQGEPYLNLRFLDWVAAAHQRHIFTATSTNAHYLTPENAQRTVRSGLDQLIVSLDGVTQESYAAYRVGGKLEKVQTGIQNVLQARRTARAQTPRVVLQFIVFRHNEDQIEAVRQLGKAWGVDQVSIKTAQIYDYATSHELIPHNDRYSRYRKDALGYYHIKNELLSHCWRMWHSAVITWDGRVVPCCFDKDARYQMGQLNEQSFEEIWRGEKYQKFREQIFSQRDQIDICKNCTEGTQVWV